MSASTHPLPHPHSHPSSLPLAIPPPPTRRKIRSDARLEQLAPAQREQLRIWLEDENRSYPDVAQRIHHAFGLVVGRSAVGVYYQRHILAQHFDDDAETAAALAALPTAQFTAALLNQARRLAYSALTRPLPHIDTASKLIDTVCRVEKQQLAEKRYALEERRVALRENPSPARPPRHPRAHRCALGLSSATPPSSPDPRPYPPAPRSQPRTAPASTHPRLFVPFVLSHSIPIPLTRFPRKSPSITGLFRLTPASRTPARARPARSPRRRRGLPLPRPRPPRRPRHEYPPIHRPLPRDGPPHDHPAIPARLRTTLPARRYATPTRPRVNNLPPAEPRPVLPLPA